MEWTHELRSAVKHAAEGAVWCVLEEHHQALWEVSNCSVDVHHGRAPERVKDRHLLHATVKPVGLGFGIDLAVEALLELGFVWSEPAEIVHLCGSDEL